MRREAKRKHERHEKAKSEVNAKVSNGSSMSKHEEASDIEEAKHFKCTECDLFFKTGKDMQIHIGKSHKSEALSTPENERRPSSMNMSLALSPNLGSREEQEQYSGQLVCTECSDLWGEKWKILCSKCWTYFTTCPYYYRFIKH